MTIKARTQIALLFYTTVNIILFTAAVYAVTIFPPLERNAGFWLGLFIAASLIVTAPMAYCLGKCVLPDAWHKKVLAEPSPLAREPSRPV
jgi:dipeptide/tripeptide permease